MKELIKFIKLWFTITILTLPFTLITACQEAKNGKVGPAGKDGASCVVDQLSNGAKITCGDTVAVILHGENGTDLAPGPYTVVDTIKPCDGLEVILRLKNGELLAHYSQGQKQYFAIIGEGDYETTDGLKCRFSVDSNLTLTDENGKYWTK